MDNNNINTPPADTSGPNEPIMPNKRSVGPVVGLVIILIIILLGGIYFWTTRSTMFDYGNNNPNSQTNPIQSNNTPSAPDEAKISIQSSSDNPATIQADLESFTEADINNLDIGL